MLEGARGSGRGRESANQAAGGCGAPGQKNTTNPPKTSTTASHQMPGRIFIRENGYQNAG